MIKEQFLYFALYPSREGVKAITTNGTSDRRGYAGLLDALDALPGTPRVPAIENYVYGQSFDDLQSRISRLHGSFLFVDYGEFGQTTMAGSHLLTQRIAVTVAEKMSNRADQGEYMLASDNTLRLLSEVHAWMLADADRGNIDWLSRDALLRAEIVPFVATELSSFGWTLMTDCTAPDPLGTHAMSKSFARRL